jgi:glycosylphosphatidylinositol transamidase (GPIT) subunit GPI8
VDHLRYEEQRAHVGYIDESCDRKFYEIPMSDFFANVQSSPMKPLEVQEKVSWDVLAKAAQATDGDTSTKNGPETCNVKDASKYKGVEPSDSLFIAVLMLFVGSIMIASQFV